MIYIEILLIMIFLHIVDDYYLQGWLASAKQKKWWKENSPNEMYKHDYLMALFMHGFSWSFMIMLPSMIFGRFNIGTFVINLVVHAYIDNLKANKHEINLIQDQVFHLTQIISTWYILFVSLH